MHYTIDLALKDGERELSPIAADALTALGTLADRLPPYMHLLAAGDMLIVDNMRALHGRTAIDDPARSRRSLRRTKVMVDAA